MLIQNPVHLFVGDPYEGGVSPACGASSKWGSSDYALVATIETVICPECQGIAQIMTTTAACLGAWWKED